MRGQGKAQGRPVAKDPAPVWPFAVSVLFLGAYFYLGYFVPVGPHCGAVFGDQTAAASADLTAMAGARYTTDWAQVCSESAASQAPLCWTLLVLGVLTAVLAFALRQIARSRGLGWFRKDVPGGGLSEEIARLASLRDAVTLTPDEFERAKGRPLED